VETSWITQANGGKPIALLPGVMAQIRRHYPGTKLAITEYNYGGGRHVSGLIAQADVLGIFGREGVFAAANWGISPRDAGQLAAFRAFTNYDGKGGRFGDRALRVTGVPAAQASVYAALDSRRANHMTIVAINKTNAPLPILLQSDGFLARDADTYTLGGAELTKRRQVPPSLSRDGIALTLPPMTVTTVSATK
jgi:hypothetical protein